MKKVFIISSIFFFLMGSFYFAYYFFLKDGSERENSFTEIGLESLNKDEKTERKENKKISKILEVRAADLSLDEEGGKLKYYDMTEQGFWLSSFDGSYKKKLSNDDFGNLSEVKWSKEGGEALIKIDDAYYFYVHGKEKTLIKKSRAMDWINFGQEILYTYEDSQTGKKTLNFSNPLGSNWKEIVEIEDDNVIMQVIPKSSKTAFWPKANGSKETEMTIVGAGGLSMETRGPAKFGSDFLWSPTGDGFIRSYTIQAGSSDLALEKCKGDGTNCTDLKFPTIASKCIWLKDGKNLICAQMKNLTENLVMPNDYFGGKFFAEDVFWKINTETGKKEKLIEEKEMEAKVDAKDLILSPSEDFLFFINRYDNSVFRIIL
ncbi:MAG: hypothetical protein V3574_02705 [Candidatus Moraniibacteriota bacterium]